MLEDYLYQHKLKVIKSDFEEKEQINEIDYRDNDSF